MRKKLVEANLVDSDPLTERAKWALEELRKSNYGNPNPLIRAMVVIAHGKDALMRLKNFERDKPAITLDPLTVIVYKPPAEEKGYIVTSGKNRSVLLVNGQIGNGSYIEGDKPNFALADDLQVEECLDSLT